MNFPLSHRRTILLVAIGLLSTGTFTVGAQHPQYRDNPASQYRENLRTDSNASAADSYAPPRRNAQQDSYRAPDRASYATEDQYAPGYRQAPSPAESSWGNARTEQYPQPDGRQPHARRTAPSQGGQLMTESLGPYNNYRQQQNIRPDFHNRRPPSEHRKAFEPGQQIAIVGSQPVLAGELLGDINQMLKPYKGKVSPEELEQQRQMLLQKMLPGAIQTKMLYQEMLANVPEEALPQIQNKLGDEFDKKQLPSLMERAKVNTAAELDAKLREFGTSIEKQRRRFSEQILSREVIRQNIESEPAVSHHEMLAYYRTHIVDYDRPARVRWEELAIWFEKFDSKDQAFQAIANMGNRVLRGAALSRVAREQSQGFTAKNGGWHDWTTSGSLRSRELDTAIFSLPMNELSQIIETEDGFHIIRVLDRETQGRSPFFKEQVRIKKKLQTEKREKQLKEYLAKVRAKVRVWTIFDDGPATAEAARAGNASNF